MNRVVLMGRLTRDPDIRYTQGENSMAVARYTLAVDRRTKEKETDFISCVAFGKNAEFADKYLKQGTKIVICGRLQTGSYTNREGQKVYTTDVVIDEQEFAESKSTATNAQKGTDNRANGAEHTDTPSNIAEGFMAIPDNVDSEGLPFN